MQRKDALQLQSTEKCVSFVGGGGKTTLLFQLAHELCSDGLNCVIMTSTHIYKPTKDLADTITDGHADFEQAFATAMHDKKPVVIGSQEASTGKICLPSSELFAAAWNQVDRVLVEADGSRHFPIKVPDLHEPVILEPTNRVVAVAGLSALGKPLSQVCHRANLASDLFRISMDTPVTPFLLASILTSENGQFKNVGDRRRYSIFLNQADDNLLLHLAAETAYYIKQVLPGCSVAGGSLQNNQIQIF